MVSFHWKCLNLDLDSSNENWPFAFEEITQNKIINLFFANFVGHIGEEIRVDGKSTPGNENINFEQISLENSFWVIQFLNSWIYSK